MASNWSKCYCKAVYLDTIFRDAIVSLLIPTYVYSIVFIYLTLCVANYYFVCYLGKEIDNNTGKCYHEA